MFEYKGMFYDDNSKTKNNFYEGGAHFKYLSLYAKLSELQRVLSPRRIVKDEDIKDYKVIKIRRQKVENNSSIMKNHERKKVDMLSESKDKKRIIKKILKNNSMNKDEKINKKKNESNIFDNFINDLNVIKNNRKIKFNDVLIKDKDNSEKTFYSKGKYNHKNDQIINLRLKKLEKFKLFKGNNISKNITIKNNNNSLPKIDSIYLKHFSGDSSDNNKNLFSDILEKVNFNNKRNSNKILSNIKNMNLSSNNQEENKSHIILNKTINKNKINNNLFKNISLIYDDKINNSETRNYNLPIFNKIYHKHDSIIHNNSPIFKIKKINSYNNVSNKNIKESFNNKVDKGKEKIFLNEKSKKKIINLYISTYKKFEKSKYNNKNKKCNISKYP